MISALRRLRTAVQAYANVIVKASLTDQLIGMHEDVYNPSEVV